MYQLPNIIFRLSGQTCSKTYDQCKKGVEVLGSTILGLKNEDFAVLIAVMSNQNVSVSKSEEENSGSELNEIFDQRKKNPTELEYLSHVRAAHSEEFVPTSPLVNAGNFGFLFLGSKLYEENLFDFILNYQVEKETVHGVQTPIYKMVSEVAKKIQKPKSYYGRNIHRTGLLFACYENNRAHIYSCMSGGSCDRRKAACIGQNYKKAERFLVEHLNEFENCSEEVLLTIGIQATISTMDPETVSDPARINLVIGVVSKERPFHVLEDYEVREHIEKVCSRN